MKAFKSECGNLFAQLGEYRKMVLSTSFQDHVTSRMMSVIIEGGNFYFQTDRNFRKYAQLKQNPNAALCIDNFQIEGVCEEIGTPVENETFCRLYKQYFPGSYQKYSLLSNEKLFVLRPVYIKKWIYDDGKPYEEIFDFKKRTYEKIAYRGV